jgi:hypothetical protein
VRIEIQSVDRQVRKFEVHEPFQTMTIRTFLTGLDDSLHQAPLCSTVFLIGPPTSENLLLGSALLAPLVDTLH